MTFTLATRISPKLTSAYANRGFAYFKKGKLKEAMADHNKAIELDPKSIKVFNNRGLIYLALKEYDKSIADFTKAIELNS